MTPAQLRDAALEYSGNLTFANGAEWAARKISAMLEAEQVEQADAKAREALRGLLTQAEHFWGPIR